MRDACQEYYVEKLLLKRCKKGEVEYLVRWSGYGPEDDSWVLARPDLDNAPEMVRQFESDEKVREEQRVADSARRLGGAGSAGLSSESDSGSESGSEHSEANRDEPPEVRVQPTLTLTNPNPN